MSNVVITKKSSSSFFVWFGLLLNLLFAGYVLSSLHILLRYKREYKVDEQLFASNVRIAVSNFLSSVVFDSGVSLSGVPEQSVAPKVVLVPGLGFASSPVRGDFLIIDGLRYKEGDYCSHGLILSIRDDRAYCRDGDDVLILRGLSAQEKKAAFVPQPDSSGGPPAEDSGEEQSGFLGLRL